MKELEGQNVFEIRAKRMTHHRGLRITALVPILHNRQREMAPSLMGVQHACLIAMNVFSSASNPIVCNDSAGQIHVNNAIGRGANLQFYFVIVVQAWSGKLRDHNA
jgi:hypothetical protein